MATKKARESIPIHIAAQILFLSNRTCCVCRERGKPVQIHHMDEDPSNNSLNNLAVLCFDCHRDTQIRGSFDRKLDAEQVILCRNDWLDVVARGRLPRSRSAINTRSQPNDDLEEITSEAETYRENNEYGLLASFYHSIGNVELRDKYIELALEKNPTDYDVCNLRCLQGKQDLIPSAVLKRELSRYTKNKDWSQRARFFLDLSRNREAIEDYIRTVQESLLEGNLFSAAYYLKELIQKQLPEELFTLALKQGEERKDLWLQVRALQELGWYGELNDLLLRNASMIEQSGDLFLLELLAAAKGDLKKSLEIRKAIIRNTHSVGDGVIVIAEPSDSD